MSRHFKKEEALGRTGKNLKDKAAEGDYELIDPLDYRILGLLPEEGTLFADSYPLGETVSNMSKKLPGKLPTTVIQARLRSLNIQGLVSNSLGVGSKGSRIWQRTTTATKVINKWKESKG